MPVLAAPSERRRRRRQCNAVLVLGSTLQGLLLVDITTAVEPSSAWSTFLCPNNYYNAGDPSPRFSRSSASTNATDRNMLDPGYGYDVAGGEQDEMEVMDDMFVSLLSDTSIKLSDLVRHFCHAWPFQRIRDQVVATALDSFDSMMIMSEQQDETHQPPLPLEWPNLRLWVRDASRRIRDQVVAPALLIAETTKIALRGQDKNETTLEEDGSETATKRINDNAEPSSSSGRQRRRSMELVQTLAGRLFSRESLEAVRTIRSILQNFHNEHGVVDIFHRGYKKPDILLAVYALNRLQKASLLYYQTHHLPQHLDDESNTACTTTSSLQGVDPTLVQDLAHYAVYANIVYGWKMDLLALRWRRKPWQHHAPNVEIVTTQEASQTHRPAYWIVLDHTQRAIVVAVRGTWSPHDVLTDLCCVTQEFDDHGNIPEQGSSVFGQRRNERRCGHQGMLVAAKALHRDVQDILRQLTEQYPEYALVLVGHSLGGGVAALLGTLLEQQYPDLRVYLFGAPCVAPANTKLHKNIVSVVTDGDPFCRLSLGHVADVSQALMQLCEDPILRYDILLRTNHQPQTMDESDLRWCYETMETLRSTKMKAEKLFPPGRILLLSTGRSMVALPSRRKRLKFTHATTGDADTDNKKKNGPTLRVVPVDYFRDLLVGPRMVDLSRHIPSLYENTLRALADSATTQ